QDRQGHVPGRAGSALRAGAPAGARGADPAGGARGFAGGLPVDPAAERDDRPGSGVDLLSRIRIVERTGSTNADLIADEGAVEGDWLVALAQEAGKGRQGREWGSAKGNFYGSKLVQLRPDDPPAPRLSLAAGLSLI